MVDTPDLADRITALETSASATATDLDAITNRLTTVENTVAAMEASLKGFAPDAVEGANLSVTEIRKGVNALSRRIFGDVVFPEPPPEPVTTE